MNEISIRDEIVANSKKNGKWFTVKEICDLCKCSDRTFKNFKAETLRESTFPQSEILHKSSKLGGNLYSEKVLKLFQTWLMKNTISAGGQKTDKSFIKQNAMENLEVGMAANAVMASGSVEAAEQFAKLLIDRTKQVKENMRLETENKALQLRNKTLQIELDESKEWYSVKRMEKLNRGKRFDWRLLKRESERMGIDIHKVFDANYEKVNAYHISVWESLFYDTLNYGD